MIENNVKSFSTVEDVVAYLAKFLHNWKADRIEEEIEDELSDEELAFSDGYEQALSSLLYHLERSVASTTSTTMEA